jgi:DNA-binding XRE family transcriptional regulator
MRACLKISAAAEGTGMKNEVCLLMNLRDLRKEAGISSKELALLSGISESSIERIEWGDSPSLANALRLANVLNLSVADIWGLKEKKD